MSTLCFLDSNILLYLHDETDERKWRVSSHVVLELGRRSSFVVSPQVLNEYYVVATSKFGGSENRSRYRDNVRRFRRACLAPYDPDVIETAWGMQDITNYAWWDLMIIASAIKAGCRYLLTEDMMHGHELGDLTIVNPFFADFAELIAKIGIPPPVFPIPEQ
jgi:predicted nucleic acid-binding protein